MKSFAVFLLACITLTACQKEIRYDVDPGTTGGNGSGSSGGGGSNNSTYYIKAKKDGTACAFNANDMAKVIDNSAAGGGIMLALIGNTSANGSSLEGVNLSISFATATSIPTGTYSEDDGSNDHIVGGVYNPNSMTMVYSAGLVLPTVKPMKIVIVTKTSTVITGTFEGAFYKTDLTSGTFTQEHILFTEGEFNLPVK